MAVKSFGDPTTTLTIRGYRSRLDKVLSSHPATQDMISRQLEADRMTQQQALKEYLDQMRESKSKAVIELGLLGREFLGSR